MSETKVSADFTKNVTNYFGCFEQAGGYEVVYRFTANFFTTVIVTLETDVASMGLFAINDSLNGCLAKNCYAFDKKQIVFQHSAGSTTYIAVDSATNTGGTYNIEFKCN